MKSKKLLTCTLAIILMLSFCLTSFAEVMYVKCFYDETDNTLYYFGKFNASTDVEVGLEINGKDYTLNTEEEPGKLNIAKLMDNNYGIGIKNPDGIAKKEIKPFALNAEGEKTYYGKSFVYDPDAVGEDVVLIAASTEFGVMAPAFSPDVTVYHIGLYNDAEMPKLTYEANEGCAVTVESEASAMGESTVITVSKDGKARNYTFTYDLITSVSDVVKSNATDSYFITRNFATEKFVFNTSLTAGRTNDIIQFWRTQDKNDEGNAFFTNVSDIKSDIAVYTFDLTNVSADNYGVFKAYFTHAYAAQYAGQEFEVTAYEVKNNDLTRDTITADAVKASKLEVGKEIATTGLINVTANSSFEIDITDYARKQLTQGNKKFSIALAVTALKNVNNVWGENIRLWCHTSAKFAPYITCESEAANAYLTNAVVADENAVLAPSFHKDVTNYKIGLPAGSEIPEITTTAVEGATATQIKKASAFGDSTVISVASVNGAVKKNYTFTFEKIKESEAASVTTYTVDSNGNATNDNLTMVSNWTVSEAGNVFNWTANPYLYLSPATRGHRDIIARFDFTNTNYDLYGNYMLNFYNASAGNESVKINIRTLKTSDWKQSEATYNNTVAGNYDEEYITTFEKGTNGSKSVDVSDLIRNKLVKGEKVITLHIAFDTAQELTATSNIQSNIYGGTYKQSANSKNWPSISFKAIKAVPQVAYLEDASVADDTAIMVPDFDKDVTKYYVGITDGAEIPEIICDAVENSTVTVTKATATGESTIVKVVSEDGKTAEKTYEFVFENQNLTTGVALNAADSYNYVSDGNTYNHATYDFLYNYANGKRYYSVIKYDLSSASVSKYDKFIVGIRNNGTLAGSSSSNPLNTTFDLKAYEAVCNYNWTRTTASASDFTIGKVIGTENISAADGKIDSYVYVDITDYIRSQIIAGKTSFSVILSLENVENYNSNNYAVIRYYHTAYSNGEKIGTYGPWLLVNKETK